MTGFDQLAGLTERYGAPSDFESDRVIRVVAKVLGLRVRRAGDATTIRDGKFWMTNANGLAIHYGGKLRSLDGAKYRLGKKYDDHAILAVAQDDYDATKGKAEETSVSTFDQLAGLTGLTENRELQPGPLKQAIQTSGLGKHPMLRGVFITQPGSDPDAWTAHDVKVLNGKATARAELDIAHGFRARITLEPIHLKGKDALDVAKQLKAFLDKIK